MTPMLAQAIDNIPAAGWKEFCLCLLVLIGIAVAWAIIYSAVRKPERTRINDEPPIKVEKTAKRYNHDAIENRFGSVERQLAENTSEIETIWTTMRKEDQDIREKNAQRFEEISRSLGRIEGRLGTTPDKK